MATTTTENRALRYTVFDLQGSSPREHAQSWAELLENLKAQKCHNRKENAPLIKLACFGDTPSDKGSYRNDKNVQEVTGIEGDIDSGLLSFDKAKRMLEEANVRAIIATTWQHTPEHPRLRVFAPLSVPHKPSERKGLAGRLNHILGGHLASESFKLSQSFFLGRNPEGEYRVEHTFDDPAQGQCLDELDAPPLGEEEAPTESPSVGVKNEDLQAAEDAGLSPEYLGGGKWKLICPWRDEHTEEGGSSSTAYFEPHTNGYEGAGFCCQHHHCAERGIRDFRQFLGLQTKSVVERMNEKHAMIQNQGIVLASWERPDPKTGQMEVDFSKVSELRTWYEDHRVKTPSGKVTTWHQIWLQSPEKRKYYDIEFNPSKPGHSDKFNLWSGFAVTPKEGDWSLLKDHIYKIVCLETDEWYRYFLDWMADAVQNLGNEKPGVALVLKGVKGSGKTTIGKLFGELFGVHALHLSGPQHLLSKHNAQYKNKAFVLADEAVWGGDMKATGALKGLITEDSILIEPKFVNPFSVPNHMRFMFCTNEEWSIPTSFDERRFAVFSLEPDRAQDTEYFRAIYRQMYQEGGLQAMLHELLSREITTNLRHAPKTEALWDEIQNSLRTEEKWWLDVLKDGRIVAESGPIEKGKDTIYNDYRYVYCDRAKVRYPKDKDSLMKRLKNEFCPEVEDTRFHNEEGNRVRGFKFPPLSRCRELFEKYCGWTIQWDR